MLLLLASAGCSEPRGQAPRERGPRSPVETAAPRELASITPQISSEPLPGGGFYELHRFRFEVAMARFAVVDLAFERPLAAALEASDGSLIFNGGFWDPDRAPEGLTVVDGQTLVPFDDDLGGGVLVVEDGRARLLDAQAGAPATEALDFAQQAKPRLVVGGAVNVRRARPRADRTALCVRDDGRTLELVVARTADDRRGRDGPTLHALAEKLVEIGCEEALNLDGGPSTGVAWRQDGAVRALPSRVAVKLAIRVGLDPR